MCVADRRRPLNLNSCPSGITGVFSEYHHVVPQTPSHVRRAFARFNSSYEKRAEADRLIDLIIALEGLFGDGNPGGVTFQVALRCAFWLKPPGDDRETLFRTIKRAYNTRSDTVHARQDKAPDEKQLDELEGIVRECLLRFLDQQILMGSVPVGNDFDHLMLTGRI